MTRTANEPAYVSALIAFRTAIREMTDQGYDRETMKHEVDREVTLISNERIREQFAARDA